MEIEDFFYEEESEAENLKEARKKMKDKDFGKLINKKDLSDFEMDELFL
tara:strand:- start:3519 stop:3665 length:147 start_codon:yes stop_codon:yes gene_type:complete